MAKKRRGNNEGSLYQLHSGSWRAQVSIQGHRKSFTAKTKRECQEWLNKTLGQIYEGMTFANTQITVDEFLSGWLSTSKASRRSSTLSHYKQLIRCYIVPNLGHMKVQNLRSDHIQMLYNSLLEQGVGAYTTLKIHAVLHSALTHAKNMGIITRNPATANMLPREPSREMTIFDENQVSQLLLEVRGQRLEALLYLAITTGMRQMELLGLKWTEVNWVRKTIRVERQLVRPDGEGIQFAPPKTQFGRRTVDLGARAVDILRAHKERQQEDKLTAGEKWRECGLIFPNSLGGPMHPRNLLRDFKKVLKYAGLPVIRFHDLRHTAASLMLNNGVPVLVVSRRLGHAKPSVTLDVYGHLIPSMQAETAEMIDSSAGR